MPSLTASLLRRGPSSSKRKSGDFVAAASLERYSVPALGRTRKRPCRLAPLELVNLKAVPAKKASRAKLVGIGLGASTNRFAFGWAARKAPIASGRPEAMEIGRAHV